MSETEQLPKVGETYHWLVSGRTYHDVVKHAFAGVVSRRGDEFEITETLIESSRDRLGCVAPWLLLLDDVDGQIEAFGEQIVAPGPPPPDMLPTINGSLEHEEARRAALQEAKSILDEHERESAVDRVHALYGNAMPTSRTMAQYSNKR